MYQKQSGEYGMECKVEDSPERRQSSGRDTFTAEYLSCTEFFVGLGASGQIETEV